jgi:hypothetical protein
VWARRIRVVVCFRVEKARNMIGVSERRLNVG